MKRYWHFLSEKDGKPVLRDGSPCIAGMVETFAGEVKICDSGLHASPSAMEALQYSPGHWVRLVECEDIVEDQGDKIVCRKRKTIAGPINAKLILFEFAADCAEIALGVAGVEDERSWQACEVVRCYARGEATEEEVAAARAAAWSARAAAGDASAAAWAAWAAAGDARAAAVAARDAARAASGAASLDAATKDHADELERRFLAAFREDTKGKP